MGVEESRAELSSLTSTLEGVLERLASMAEAAAANDEAMASELFEVERGLQAAARRLAKLVDDLADSA